MNDYYRQANSVKEYTSIEYFNMGVRSVAMRRLNQAVKNGTIKPKTECEVCGRNEKTVAHHWSGYDKPFDVWWVCRKCNSNLPCHDGSVTLEDAATMMRNKMHRRSRSKIYKTYQECEVCGVDTRVGRYVLFNGASDDGWFLCQHCFSNIVGDA